MSSAYRECCRLFDKKDAGTPLSADERRRLEFLVTSDPRSSREAELRVRLANWAQSATFAQPATFGQPGGPQGASDEQLVDGALSEVWKQEKVVPLPLRARTANNGKQHWPLEKERAENERPAARGRLPGLRAWRVPALAAAALLLSWGVWATIEKLERRSDAVAFSDSPAAASDSPAAASNSPAAASDSPAAASDSPVAASNSPVVPPPGVVDPFRGPTSHARRPQSQSARSVVEASVPEPYAPEPGTPVPAASVPAASELLRLAREHMAAGRWSQAATGYQQLRKHYPASPASHTVLVTLGQLQLDRLAQPGAALSSFSSYLMTDGPLSQEARFAKIRALRQLGRTDEERAEIVDFLSRYPGAVGSESLAARLKRLRRKRASQNE